MSMQRRNRQRSNGGGFYSDVKEKGESGSGARLTALPKSDACTRPDGKHPVGIAHVEHTFIDLQFPGKQSQKRGDGRRNEPSVWITGPIE